MSYVESRKAGQNRAVTAGVVAIIQTGVVLALVNGFNVKFFPDPPRPPLAGEQIPLPPPPKPVDDPKPHVDPKTDVTVPPIPHPLPRDPVPFPVPTELPKGPLGPTAGTGDTLSGPIDPPSPHPSFLPKLARPTNSPATWVMTNDYPSRDLREGNQGRVGFMLGIAANGRAESCIVTASSGFAGLDQATCDKVMKRARFEAATDEYGTRVAGSYSGTIRWVIPKD